MPRRRWPSTGRVVAAATEDSFARVAGIGYALTGGFPSAAAQACLHVAGLDAGDIDEISVVSEETGAPAGGQGQRGFERAPVRVVDPARADAVHAVMSDQAATAVVVCSAHPPVLAAFAHHSHHDHPHQNHQDQGDGLGPRVDIPGAERLVAGAAGLAAVLGIPGDDPFAALDRLSVGAEPGIPGRHGPRPVVARGRRRGAGVGGAVGCGPPRLPANSRTRFPMRSR
jgi:hypothetical protein